MCANGCNKKWDLIGYFYGNLTTTNGAHLYKRWKDPLFRYIKAEDLGKKSLDLFFYIKIS